DARLFFGTVLGAQAIEEGWSCPRRRQELGQLVVRIHRHLLERGWEINQDDRAASEIDRDIRRIASFRRTKERASAIRANEEGAELPAILQALQAFGWNREERELRQHQRLGVMHGLAAAHSANFSVPGSGKTATTLAIAATHLASGTIEAILVIGPLSCFR